MVGLDPTKAMMKLRVKVRLLISSKEESGDVATSWLAHSAPRVRALPLWPWPTAWEPC